MLWQKQFGWGHSPVAVFLNVSCSAELLTGSTQYAVRSQFLTAVYYWQYAVCSMQSVPDRSVLLAVRSQFLTAVYYWQYAVRSQFLTAVYYWQYAVSSWQQCITGSTQYAVRSQFLTAVYYFVSPVGPQTRSTLAERKVLRHYPCSLSCHTEATGWPTFWSDYTHQSSCMSTSSWTILSPSR